MTTGGQFDIPTVTRSFETSLRELKTEYVDFLMLHDCSLDDLRVPELLRFLEAMKQQGKVKRFGLATYSGTIEEAVLRYPEYADVVQFPSSAASPSIRKVRKAGSRLTITHSALGACLNLAHGIMQQNSRIAAQLRERFRIDARNKTELATLLVRYAITENPGGLVLFSSTSEENINRNHQATTKGPLSSDEIEVIDGVLATPPASVGASAGSGNDR